MDGISNKIGFSKRSFAEWGKQISTSFKESEGVINSFKNVLKTVFTVPVQKDNHWIKNSLGEIVNKENIDSFIPQLDSNRVEEIITEINAVNKAKGSWNAYYKTLHDGEDFVVNLIKNTDDLSKLTGKDLVTANQQAREAAIAHNATLKQQTLSAKAATVAMKALSAVGNMIAFALIAKGVQLASDAIDHYVNRSKYAAEAMEEAQ